MKPSDTRLLSGIRDALAPLRAADRPEADRRLIAAVDLALDELLLRQDDDFMSAQLATGLTLVREAEAAGAPPPVAASETVEGIALTLGAQVAALMDPARDAPEPDDLLARIVDWENRLHARRAGQGRGATADDATQPPAADLITADRIQAWLRNRDPDWRDLRVVELRRLSGGFSKVTLILDVEDARHGRRSLVLRAEQPLNLVFLEGTRLRNEFEVLQLASKAGLPVAEPLCFEPDTGVIGMPFLISRRAAGRNFGSRVDVSDEISPALVRDMVSRLVQIHATPIDLADPHVRNSHLGDWARQATLSDCLAAQVAHWRQGARAFQLPSTPILERSLGWLARHVPPVAEPPVLVHGDFGLHNLLIGDDGRITCILDWEAVTIGDPLEDLVWLSEGLKGQFDREYILSLYEELGGRPIDRASLPFFDVFCAVRFAVTCPRAIDLFENNPRVGLDALQLGLLYMYHGTSALNANIAIGERLSEK